MKKLCVNYLEYREAIQKQNIRAFVFQLIFFITFFQNTNAQDAGVPVYKIQDSLARLELMKIINSKSYQTKAKIWYLDEGVIKYKSGKIYYVTDSSISVAGKNISYKKIKAAHPINYNGLYAKTNLLAPFDPSTPVLTIGLEGKINRIGIEATYGHATPPFIFGWHSYLFHEKYRELRGELRYYSYPRHHQSLFFDKKILFWSVEYIYLPRSYAMSNSWYTSTNGSSYQYDVSNISDTRQIVVLKMGKVINVSGDLYLEFFAGLGNQFIIIQHHPLNETLLSSRPFTEWIESVEKNEGKKRRLFMSLGIKLSYRLF